MDEEKVILVCPDTMEGIFSAVYEGWMAGAAGKTVEIHMEEPSDSEFFTTVRLISADPVKSEKVLRCVRRRLGYPVCEAVCFGAASLHPDKGTVIFRVLRKALGKGRCRREILEDLADPDVNLLSKLRVKVWHELHRYYGFVRFRMVGRTVLFSRITPENNILELLSPHFENRFPRENWIIYDALRNKVLLHPAGGNSVLRTGVSLSESILQKLVEADQYEELWRVFCRSITIRERKNPGLQQQLLPLKFRGEMPEFFDKNRM